MIAINLTFVFISALMACTLHNKGISWTERYGLKSLQVAAAAFNLIAVVFNIAAASLV